MNALVCIYTGAGTEPRETGHPAVRRVACGKDAQNNMRWFFTLLIGLSAFFIAGCAAVFSVKGLGLLFAGSMVAVMTMAFDVWHSKLHCPR